MKQPNTVSMYWLRSGATSAPLSQERVGVIWISRRQDPDPVFSNVADIVTQVS